MAFSGIGAQQMTDHVCKNPVILPVSFVHVKTFLGRRRNTLQTTFNITASNGVGWMLHAHLTGMLYCSIHNDKFESCKTYTFFSRRSGKVYIIYFGYTVSVLRVNRSSWNAFGTDEQSQLIAVKAEV